MSAASHNAWTDVADQRLLRMYREGYGAKIIAEASGRSPKAVSDRRRKLLEEKHLTS